MKFILPALLFLALSGLNQTATAGPMCFTGNPACITLTFQLRSIYAPSPDNNYGRRTGFLYQDYGKWRVAPSPPHPAPKNFDLLSISEDTEQNYILGQRYALLTPEQKWQVLLAKRPEHKIPRLESQQNRNQVDNEARFFQQLNSQRKIKYMMLSPQLRHTAITTTPLAAAMRFIDV